MVEMDLAKTEELRRLRDSMMSPYVAMGWEIESDFPLERRVTLSKKPNFSIVVCFILFCLYILPGLIYVLVKQKKETKTLLY